MIARIGFSASGPTRSTDLASLPFLFSSTMSTPARIVMAAGRLQGLRTVRNVSRPAVAAVSAASLQARGVSGVARPSAVPSSSTLTSRAFATSTTTETETDLESTPTNFMLSQDLVQLRDYVRRIALEKVRTTFEGDLALQNLHIPTFRLFPSRLLLVPMKLTGLQSTRRLEWLYGTEMDMVSDTDPICRNRINRTCLICSRNSAFSPFLSPLNVGIR